MTRAPFPLAVLAAALVASGHACALGLGPVRAPIGLGQVLNLAVPVTLGEGEGLDAGCVSAEVHVGDVRVNPEQIALRVEPAGGAGGQALLRLRTGVAVDEPVVSVTLSAGCPTRVTRRYTLFADPPADLSAPPTMAAAPAAMPLPEVHQVAGAPAAAPALRPSDSAAVVPARPASPEAARKAARRSDAGAAPDSAKPRQAEVRTAKSATRSTTKATTKTARRDDARRTASAPRLQVDLLEPPKPQIDVQARLLAAEEAAREATIAAQTAQARVAQAEAVLMREREAARADRAALLDLRRRVDEVEQRAGWLPWLFALVGVFAATTGALAWRLRRRQHEPWWQPGMHPEGAAQAAQQLQPAPQPEPPTEPSTARGVENPAPTAPTTAAVAAVVPGADPIVPAVTPPAEAATVAVVNPLPQPDTELLFELTADEQIDLEQQVDFFVALGQDDAAVNLLFDHLHRTGGASPLPYLKLFEIYRRLGEREAYARLGERFARRFSVAAPDWDTDPAHLRGLDEHPALLAEIERRWSQPGAAMVWLESQLLHHTDGSEMLDLPAVQDALFLYQVAKELQRDAGTGVATEVDLLLPIADEVARPAAVADGASAAASAARAAIDAPSGRALPKATVPDPWAPPTDLDVDLVLDLEPRDEVAAAAVR